MNTNTELIQDGQSLKGAKYRRSLTPIPTYDNGFGPVWISRNSIGVYGVVRAQTWETAYEICEDEFFAEADETLDELKAEYGVKRDHVKIVKDSTVQVATEHTGVGERVAVYPDDYPGGKLAPEFVRWEVIETPDPDAWMENELFEEAYGFRPNGPNTRDKHNHGIYQKDLNGDYLDELTPELADGLGIELEVTDDDDIDSTNGQ